MTNKEIKEYKAKIDLMSQTEMANLWRFAPLGSPYFDSSSPIHEYFKLRFEGLTPEISKSMGWE